MKLKLFHKEKGMTIEEKFMMKMLPLTFGSTIVFSLITVYTINKEVRDYINHEVERMVKKKPEK